jgi:hypothetical protein
LLDADANVHYVASAAAGGGITLPLPLSCLEIHQAWVDRRWAEVEQRLCGPTPFRMTDLTRGSKSMPSGAVMAQLGDNWDPATEMAIFSDNRIGDYYHYLNYGGGPETLSWMDEHAPPRLLEHGATVASRHGALEKRVLVSQANEIDWSVDQVQIDLALDDEAWAVQATTQSVTLHISLRHSMPNLEQLLIKLGSNEPWIPFAPDTVDEATGVESLAWVLWPGKNQVMAKGVNSFGREGHVSRILLRYMPAPSSSRL